MIMWFESESNQMEKDEAFFLFKLPLKRNSTSSKLNQHFEHERPRDTLKNTVLKVYLDLLQKSPKTLHITVHIFICVICDICW